MRVDARHVAGERRRDQLFIAWLVAVTFIKSRLASISVGAAGFLHVPCRGAGVRAPAVVECASRGTDAVHVSVDALAVGRAEAQLQAIRVSEHRVEHAAAKLVEISVGVGVVPRPSSWAELPC